MSRTVKAHIRIANLKLVSAVRPPWVLEKTLDYLLDNIVDLDLSKSAFVPETISKKMRNFDEVYKYLFNRTRQIR